MKHWIGKSVLAIGLIHSIFGIVFLGRIFGVLLGEGLFNTVNGQMDREAFFWFMYFGFAMMILGAFINWNEQRGYPLPAFLGIALMAITLVAVIIMPASGAWLLFAPSIGLLMRQRRKVKANLS